MEIKNSIVRRYNGRPELLKVAFVKTQGGFCAYCKWISYQQK